MHNLDLIQDYLKRAKARLKAIQVLVEEESYADVVRESQEVVELCLKSLLRFSSIEAPRNHDVSGVLLEHKDRLPSCIQKDAQRLAKISHSLRRDRELAFYGSEDLTPSEFYSSQDGEQAFGDAKFVFEVCWQILD